MTTRCPRDHDVTFASAFARLLPMNPSRSILVALACLGLGATACTATHSSASELDAPPSTIGLGFEFEVDPGSVSGVADVRAVDADEITSIVMVGDSITVASTPALEERFTALGFDNVLIEAQTGKRMTSSSGDNSSGRSIVEFLVNSDPDGDHADELWIVALGTNDINQYGSVEQITAEVDEVLSVVPDDAALVWVDTFYRQESESAGRVNTAISERLEARGNSVVAPWSVFADGAVSGDGFHPTPDGRAVFADVVVGTVESFLDS
jgi:lysophospholipase L1-like esterase